MFMYIDKSRHNNSAMCIYKFRIRICVFYFFCCPHHGYGVPIHCYCSIFIKSVGFVPCDHSSVSNNPHMRPPCLVKFFQSVMKSSISFRYFVLYNVTYFLSYFNYIRKISLVFKFFLYIQYKNSDGTLSAPSLFLLYHIFFLLKSYFCSPRSFRFLLSFFQRTGSSSTR